MKKPNKIEGLINNLEKLHSVYQKRRKWINLVAITHILLIVSIGTINILLKGNIIMLIVLLTGVLISQTILTSNWFLDKIAKWESD